MHADTWVQKQFTFWLKKTSHNNNNRFFEISFNKDVFRIELGVLALSLLLYFYIHFAFYILQ